ncbi:MAG: Rrf2 family transcriptional regulator [Candidatus Omnitrophica bacterium]|nr:Rrf2 family transcriptional regulator [Candidatus Omnitrophota bacterium]
MFKIYSKACEYALRALTQIPKDNFDRKFLAVEMARKAKIPIHSARKTLQLLVECGYLEAISGPGGGYRLNKNPENITLLDIIKKIDGKDAFNRCVMGLPQCGSINPCPIHGLWAKVKIDMEKEMEKKTLLKLMAMKAHG